MSSYLNNSVEMHAIQNDHAPSISRLYLDNLHWIIVSKCTLDDFLVIYGPAQHDKGAVVVRI
jgi:hypothetical protein